MSAPKFSLASKRQLPPTKNGVKRPRAALDDEDEDGEQLGQAETISHFDKTAGGAIDTSRKQETQGPLVIPRQMNRNWKKAANQRKRQKSGLPEGAGRGKEGLDERVAAVEAELEAAKPSFGLNTYPKNDGATPNEALDTAEQAQRLPPEPNADAEPVRKQTDEERALDALLGKTTTDKTLIIEASSRPPNEEDVFNDDVASAPPGPSMDDYARVPVEQFGAALLRGMGWKDGEGVGSQRGVKLKKESLKPPERRANLLGIGAKQETAIQELGAWGRAAKGKEVKIYNPVLLKDSQTGELFTEEELKAKQEKDEKAKYEAEWERKHGKAERSGRSDRDDRRREHNGGSRDHRSDDRRREHDGGSRDYRREKDRNGDSRDRRREKDRGSRYDDDEDYRRRKDKERHSRDERNGEDRRHRDRDEVNRHRGGDPRRERDRGHRR